TASEPPQVLQRQEEEELQMRAASQSQQALQRQEEEELQMKTTSEPPQVLQRQEEEELQMKTASKPYQVLQRQEEEELQADGIAGHAPDVSETLEERIDASRGSGQNLPDQMLSSFGRHLGRDFSDVRIHADSEADALSRQLGAKAFTTGQDIFFRASDYDPQSAEGMKLLSHEMTHVAQQGGASIQMQSVDTGEKASPESKVKAESELTKAKDKALSAMTKANIKDLLYNAALCRKIGAEGPATDALDRAARLALEQLEKQTKAFKVDTSSAEAAKEMLQKIAVVQLLGGEATTAIAAVRAWAETAKT
ncbi:MAG: DUF4157 domain-containing protein, partial [Dehalococcoidia bacterium]